VFAITTTTALPDGIDALALAAADEGFGMIRHLIGEFRDAGNMFDQPGEALWEARAGGRLIGVCGLNRDPYAAPLENAGRVRRLYVSQPWRRRGAATALLERVIGHARGEFSMLTVFTTDPAAAGFYGACGFDRVTGVTKRSFVMRLHVI
jgi:GNAT superfamily N-acetyltransferase